MRGKENKHYQEDEIDLLELLQIVWSGRRRIIKFAIIFGLIGVFIAVFSSKEYTSSTTVVPQTSGSKSMGGLGGLAAIAGVNLGRGNSESIPPSLYPKIVQSIPFQKELLEVPLQFSNVDRYVTYKEYYAKYQKFNLLSFLKSYTIGLPSKFIGLFKNNNKELSMIVNNDSIYRISLEESKLFNQLQKQLSIDNNTKEGFVKISFTMPEALPAAQMTKKAQELLQKAITNFKIQKAQEDYEFIEERHKEAREKFITKQGILANFKDKNQGLFLSRSQFRLERLQSDYNLAYSLYSELTKQLESQKIKLKEKTPVFTVIDPVSVPIQTSKPKRILIFIIWISLGIFLGVAFVFITNWVSKLKNN